MILALLVLYSVLCPGPTRAQEHTAVRVLELPGLQPIAGAAVLHESGVRRLTGPDGHTSLPFTGPGPYRLHIERLGFAPADTTVAAFQPGEVLTIGLTPQPLALPGIQVNAPPGASFESLGGEVRVRTPERTVHARGIGLDPLEELASSGVASSASDFSALPIIRSTRWDQGAIFLGPLRMWGPHHGLGLVGAARTSGTEEIRVGGVVPPLEYANATGAILRAEPRSGGSSRWSRSSVSLLDGTLSVGGPLGSNGDGQFVVTGSRSLDSGLLGAIVGGGLPFRYSSVEAHAAVPVTSRLSLRASAYGSDDQVSFDASAYSEDLESSWTSRATAAAVDWAIRPGSELVLTVAGSRYRTRLSAVVPGEHGPQTNGRLTDYRLAALWSQDLRFATLKFGLDAAHLETEVHSAEGAPGPALDGRDERRVLGALVGIETVRGASAFRAGVRIDVPTQGDFVIQPRMEWTRELSGVWRMHASGGYSAQWVSALNAEAMIPQAPIWWTHTQGLRATTAWGIGGGITGSIAPAVRLRAEIFGSRVENLTRWRQPLTEPAGIVQEPARSAGLGLDLVFWEGRPASLRWDYTLAWASVGAERRAPPWDVRHSGNLRLSWRPGGWDFALGLAYASGRALPSPLGRLPGLDLGTPFGLQYGGLHVVQSETPRRLSAYLRVDVGIARNARVLASDWQVSLKVLNATRRINPLYYRLGNDGSFAPSGDPPARNPSEWSQRLDPVKQLPLVVSLGLSVHVF